MLKLDEHLIPNANSTLLHTCKIYSNLYLILLYCAPIQTVGDVGLATSSQFRCSQFGAHNFGMAQFGSIKLIAHQNFAKTSNCIYHRTFGYIQTKRSRLLLLFPAASQSEHIKSYSCSDWLTVGNIIGNGYSVSGLTPMCLRLNCVN